MLFLILNPEILKNEEKISIFKTIDKFLIKKINSNAFLVDGKILDVIKHKDKLIFLSYEKKLEDFLSKNDFFNRPIISLPLNFLRELKNNNSPIKDLAKELIRTNLSVNKEVFSDFLVSFYDKGLLKKIINNDLNSKLNFNDITSKAYKKLFFLLFKDNYPLKLREFLLKNYSYKSYPLVFDLEKIREILKEVNFKNKFFYAVSFLPNTSFYLNLKEKEIVNYFFSLFYEHILKQNKKVIFFYSSKYDLIFLLSESQLDQKLNKILDNFREFLNLHLKENYVSKGKKELQIYRILSKNFIFKNLILVDKFTISYSKTILESDLTDKTIKYLKALVNLSN